MRSSYSSEAASEPDEAQSENVVSVMTARGQQKFRYTIKKNRAYLSDDAWLKLSKVKSGTQKSVDALSLTVLDVTDRIWPNKKIPYKFDTQFCCLDAMKIAFTAWEKAGLSFVEATSTDTDYVLIKTNNEEGSCGSSAVGRQGGMQELLISPESKKCDPKFSSLHELGHAIGLHHEHQRPDRRLYIDLPLSFDVEPGFQVYDLTDGKQTLGIYDLNSVMHYSSKHIPGMLAKNGSQIENTSVSVNDLQQVHLIYKLRSVELSACLVTSVGLKGELKSHFNLSSTPRSQCLQICDSMQNAKDLKCTWGAEVLRTTTHKRCMVTDCHSSTAHFISIADSSKEECSSQCNSPDMAKISPRLCWLGNESIVAKMEHSCEGVLVPPSPLSFDECMIKGGAGNVLFSGRVTREVCSKECDSRDILNPQRHCRFGATVLRETPLGQCLITRCNNEALVVNQSMSFYECRVKCNSDEIAKFPERRCLWASQEKQTVFLERPEKACQ